MSVGDIPPGSHSGSVTTPGFEGIESGHRWQLFIVACSGVHEDTDSEKTREITFTESSPTKWRCTSMYCSPLVGAARRSQPHTTLSQAIQVVDLRPTNVYTGIPINPHRLRSPRAPFCPSARGA